MFDCNGSTANEDAGRNVHVVVNRYCSMRNEHSRHVKARNGDVRAKNLTVVGETETQELKCERGCLLQLRPGDQRRVNVTLIVVVSRNCSMRNERLIAAVAGTSNGRTKARALA